MALSPQSKAAWLCTASLSPSLLLESASWASQPQMYPQGLKFCNQAWGKTLSEFQVFPKENRRPGDVLGWGVGTMESRPEVSSPKPPPSSGTRGIIVFPAFGIHLYTEVMCFLDWATRRMEVLHL